LISRSTFVLTELVKSPDPVMVSSTPTGVFHKVNNPSGLCQFFWRKPAIEDAMMHSKPVIRNKAFRKGSSTPTLAPHLKPLG
jgi:hypothetical protein